MSRKELLIAFKEGKLAKAELKKQLRALNQQPCKTPLSEGQKGLWMLQKISPEMSAYNVPLAFRVGQKLDIEKFKQACSLLREQYPIITSVFGEDDEGAPYQRFWPSQPLLWQQEDISAFEADVILPYLVKKAKEPFSLENGPLMRIHLFSRSLQEHIVLIVIHHIIFDGVSSVHLVKFLLEAYQNLINGENPEAKPFSTSYYDFVQWEQAMLSSKEGEEHRNYWRKQLSGTLPVMELPTDRPRFSSQSSEGQTYTSLLSPELTKQIKSFAKAQYINLSIILLGIYKVLLYRYTGQEDIIVGMPTVGRPEKRFDSQIGYFVNMLPVRSQVNGGLRFAKFIKELQLNVVDGLDHAVYPFPLIVRELNVSRDQTNSPVFQTAFAYQNFLQATSLKTIGAQDQNSLHIEIIEDIHQEGEFEFALEIFDHSDHFILNTKYDPNLYNHATIQRMMGHYAQLAEEVVNDPNLTLGEYSLMSKKEQATILFDWNATQRDYPKEKTIQELFQQQVEKTPDNVAVVFDDEKLTYQELNLKANQLAHRLRNNGIKPDSIVGIMVEQSIEMVIGILGTLKASGAYLPIDPGYPEERVAFMLKDSGTAFLLTQTKLMENLRLGINVEIIDLKSNELYKGENNDIECLNKATDLAYVIYTSGTTGVPKGVMIEHKSLVNLCYWHNKYHSVTPIDRTTRYAGFGFDASVLELFPYLIMGASIYIIPETIRLDPAQINAFYETNEITISFLPTKICEQYLELKNRSLRILLTGGDKLTHTRKQSYELIDNYGPTENTVTTTIMTVDDTEGNIPIGKPIDNTCVYIVNSANQLQPIGVPGELCISGDGLARGYLNRPELTIEAFIPNTLWTIAELESQGTNHNSFHTPPFRLQTSRLYRTGDLARWLPDGNIEFLGRIDHQVKIKGYRIELGEIESRLLKHESIKETIVIAKEDRYGNKYLCAYIVGDKELNATELRNYLSKQLPEYMIPSYFIPLEKIPLTSNNKVDRKMLPDPAGSLTTGAEYEAPRSDIEKIMAQIWQEVLEVKKIGINDNFFALGGDSIKAIQVLTRLQKDKLKLDAKTLLTNPVIKDLSKYVILFEQSITNEEIQITTSDTFAKRIGPEEFDKILKEYQDNLVEKNNGRIIKTDKNNIKDIYPLSPLQQGMLFHTISDENSRAYFQQMTLALDGDIDIAVFEESFNNIIKKYDTFKTMFIYKNVKEPVQLVLKDRKAEIHFEDISKMDDNEKNEYIATFMRKDRERGFYLSKDILIRMAIFKLDKKSYKLIISTQHIIMDGWSLGIVLNGIFENYCRLKTKQPIDMQETKPYIDFIKWITQQNMDEGLLYWQNYLAGYEQKAEIPCRFDRVNDDTKYILGQTIFTVNKTLTSKLNKLAKQHGITLNTIFQTAWGILLQKYNYTKDVVFGTIVSGRPPEIEGIESMVGMCMNTVPVRMNFEHSRSFNEIIKQIQNSAFESVKYDYLPLAKIQANTELKRDLINHVLIYENIPFETKIKNNETENEILIDVKAFEILEQTNYNFNVYVMPFIETTIKFTYNKNIYDEYQVQNIEGHFKKILQQIADQPEEKISSIEILSGEEKDQILDEFNNTSAGYPKNKTVYQLFEEQVQKTPDKAAVVFEEDTLTYRQLNNKANQIARMLQKNGVKSNSIIGIMVDRSLEMIVGIMGILKAGGTYLPINPEFPEDRILYMLEDSETDIILTETGVANNIDFKGKKIDLKDKALYAGDVKNLKIANSPSDLAYIMYTSGTTGRPKGVMIPHQALVNFLISMGHRPGISSKDKMLAVTTYCFDIAGLELFLPLINGGQCYICSSEKTKDVEKLKQEIKRVNPTIMQATPVTWTMLFQAGWNNEEEMKILCGGEALPERLKKYFVDTGSDAWNMFGPTETTIWSTTQQIKENEPISIGKPIANMQIYILDKDQKPSPVGILGELCIGGDGLAGGYLKKPELTKEKFIQNPFKVGTKIYKTGDLARWFPDGNIEFVGRIDHQVKIRGFRIELGEIESQLNKHPEIKDSVAVVKEHEGIKQLVVYFVRKNNDAKSKGEDGALLDAQVLHDYLQTALPGYMIPGGFVELEAIPLTPNGKVDRKELMSRKITVTRTKKESLPESVIEEKVLEIWKEVLNIDNISTEDGFYEVGGDSFSAVSVAEKIKQNLNCDFNVTTLFKYSNIKEICRYISGTKETTVESVVKSNEFNGTHSRPGSSENGVKVIETPDYYGESLAIVGISCQVPEAKNHYEFWENLKAGKETNKFFSKEELYEFNLPEEIIENPDYIPVQSVIEGKDLFDPGFFNISPRELVLMDPQLRLLLIHSWKALEDAGYVPGQIPDTSVFMSASNNFYQTSIMTPKPYQVVSNADEYMTWLYAQGGTIPTIISYKLGLKGPSFSVHSNCSSSLAGLYSAYHSLMSREAKYALVGAATISAVTNLGYIHQPGLNFSSDGHIKTFDASADGMAGGEGVTVILLKRADDAVKDGDHIYAIIRGIGVNNDGSDKVGFYAPSVKGQAEVIEKVLNSTKINPESIGYVEAHGTGTRIGDSVEFAALNEVYRKYTTKKQFCGLGSVKTNIGHLDTAAGLAGCIKVAMILQNNEIPPTLNYRVPNPIFDLDNSPFYIVERLKKLEQNTIPYRVALSSFGIGGTNTHIILEQYPSAKTPEDADPGFEDQGAAIIPLSAKNNDRLIAYAKEMLDFLKRKPENKPDVNLTDLAYTLQVGREAMKSRVIFIAGNLTQLTEKLKDFVNGEEEIEGCLRGKRKDAEDTSNLVENVDSQELIDNWIAKGNVKKLGEYWVKGLSVEWSKLYGAHKPRRVSLPTYPFAGKHYWISDLNRETKSGGLVVTSPPAQQRRIDRQETVAKTIIKPFPNSLTGTASTVSNIPEKPSNISLQSFSGNLISKSVDQVQQSVVLSLAGTSQLQPGSSSSSRPVNYEQTASIKEATESRFMTQSFIDPITALVQAKGPQSNVPVKRLQEELRTSLAEALFLDANEVDIDKKFIDQGLDSIIGVEWIKAVNKQYGTEIAATKVYDYPSVREFAEFIRTELSTQGESRTNELFIPEKIPAPTIGLPTVTSVQVKRPQSNISVKRLQEELRTSLAEALFIEANEVDIDKKFKDLGLDSIIGVEWIKAVNKQYGTGIAATKVYDYPSIREFTKFLETELQNSTSTASHLSETSNAPASSLQSPGQRQQPQTIINDNIAKERLNVSVPQINTNKTITSQINSKSSGYREAIAIVGISGRFPDAKDLSQYWDNLANARNSVKEIPKSRWDVNQYYDPRPFQKGKVNCKWLGMLEDVEYFDPLFFNISPAEAEVMDPQHRLFLQEGYRAFEDAGFNCQSLSNKNCGVYLGIMNSEYSMLIAKILGGENFGSTDHSYAIAAARIPYFLNLKGPAIPIDTACSSSLVGTHLACQALSTHEIDMALVGGVTLYLVPEAYIGMCASGMLSPEGQCKTFDNRADGFVPGEGVGALVLKRLKDAEADGDHIYGVIVGSGINQDGKTNGITAPSAKSQMDLVRGIYDKYQINPESIGYVEMHGTGTKLGDPIELDALATVFKEKTKKKNFCAIGSVKSNIGHTSAAAGVASIQKVLSCMQYKQLVPTLNFKVPNEHFNFKESPFYVNTELRPWEAAEGIPRRAGVSSFGYSGTNAHIVIEEYLPQNAAAGTPISVNAENPIFFVLSAKSREQLKIYAESMKDWVVSHEDLNLTDMAYTLQVGREPMDYRLVVLADSRETLLKALTGFIDGKPSPDVLTGQRGKDEVTIFETEEDAESVLQIFILKRRLKKIAELWVKGLNIDWNQLYGGANALVRPRRISLPAYPFARERYWVSKGDVQPAGNPLLTMTSAASIHPLLQQNTSDFTEQWFSSTFTGREIFLADHVVQGRRLIPGVAYLEMARAAMGQAAGVLKEGLTGIQLKNVVWTRPIEVGDQPVKVHIGLFPESNGQIAYEVYSEPDTNDAEPVIHSQGRVLLSSVAEVPVLDLKVLQSECSQSSFPSTKCYETFKAMGIAYGPGHQGIETLYVGAGQVLAKLSLPSSVADTQDQFVLHPSMLDSALHASIGFMLLAKETGSMASFKPAVPFALDSLEIIGKLTPQMWALIKLRDGSAFSDKVQKFDIDLCDEQGTVCVRMKGYSARVMEDEADSPAATEKLQTLILEPVWEEQAIGQEATAPDYVMHLAILCELGEISRESIESRMNGVRCLTLALEQQGIAERFSSYSAIMFEEIQNILKEKPKGKVLIQIVISTRYEAQLCSGLAGMLKTAQLENPQIIGQMIEVGSEEDVESITKKLKENSRYPLINQIRYQVGKRLVAGLGEVGKLPEAKIPWKDQGIYLITGGAGGLGLIFSKEIALKVKGTTLILTGRSLLNEDKQAKLKELESLGTRIIYKQVDVTQEKAVNDLIQSIRVDCGGINGIIHSAGIIKDNFIIKKTKDELLEVLAPKVAGLVYLDQASQDQPLDFFILFSSMAGVVGCSGQADYATANAFMNAYAKYRKALVASQQRHGQTISISWPLWQEGGMHVDVETEKVMKQKTGTVAMRTQSGIQALYHGLASGKAQVMVMEGELKWVREALLNMQTGTEALKTLSTVKEKTAVSSVDKDFLQEKAVNYFKKLLSSVIKLPIHHIDADAPMEKYGIDSIMVTQMTNELEKVFGSLSKTLFFEYQNIKSLTGYFMENYRDKLAELLGIEEKTVVPAGLPQNLEVMTEMKKPAVSSHRRPRLTSLPVQTQEEKAALDIAIIGLSGRYPQARNLREFWKNLRDGKDCISEIPKERWDYSLYFDEDKNKLGKTYSKWGGFIDGVDQFDPLFFNISPRDAVFMDPQERLFLECAYETMEDAGYGRQVLGGPKNLGGRQDLGVREAFSLHQDFGPGGNVGVYVGVMYEEYQLYGAQAQSQGRTVAVSGDSASIANRVSYFCNFHGPSMSVNTMCSSSLTAIHLACHSLQRGECKLAIAGGVNVSVHPNKYLLLGQGKFVSSKGRCESFGEGGDGYVPGEGVGAVLLKPLAKAVADGDHIYGIIKATSINHGGKTNGYTVPNPNAQAELIEQAFMQAGINVRTLSYLEAHGTGTSLGDPIEITGLAKAFQKQTQDKQFCAIGSVKSNIGHSESAAGIAGVTKVLLQLKYGQLAPSLHSRILNPNIDFANTPFVVQQELAEWKRPVIEKDGETEEYPRIAGISSFGAGGANAHVVIEEYIPQLAERFKITAAPGNSAAQMDAVIVLSARTEEQLKEQARRLLVTIQEKEFESVSLVDVAYTLQVGREPMEERLGLIVSSTQELAEKLKSFIEGHNDTPDLYRGQIKLFQETLAIFTADEDLQKGIDVLISKGKYGKLLDLWVKGLVFDWNKLYGDTNAHERPHRTSLPTYPFIRDSYWFPNFEMQSVSGIEGTASLGNTASLAPLVPQQSLKLSTVQELALANTSDKPGKISLRSLSVNPILATKPVGQIEQPTELMQTEISSPPVRNISPAINETKPVMPVQPTGSVEDLQEELATSLAEVLYMKREDLDIDKKFADLGMDSITGVEWIQRLNDRYGTSIAATKVYDYPTITSFAGYLEQVLAKQGNLIVPNGSVSETIPKVSEPTGTEVQVSQKQSAVSLESLQEELATSLAEVLYMKREDLDIDKNFTDLGMDSVTGVEWIQRINNRYGTSITATKLYDYPTIGEFSKFVEKEWSKLTPSLSLEEVIQQLEKGNLDIAQASYLIKHFFKGERK